MAGANTAAVDQEQGQEQDEEMWEEGEDGEGENDGEGEEVGERDDGRRGDGEGEDDEEDSDEFVLAELLALNGWCSSKTLSPYYFQPIQRISSIPSPFANREYDVDAQVLDLMSGPVQQLWRAFHSRRKPAERHIPSDGSVACCGFYTGDNGKLPTNYYTMRSADNQLDVDIDRSDKLFRIRRLKRAVGRSVTVEDGFFIINKDFDRFLINGQAMRRGAVAGPLTDFAVIELDETAVFWWRNHQAFDYTPGAEFRKYPWYWGLIYWGLIHGIEQNIWREKRGLKRSRSTDGGREGKKLKPNSHHSDDKVIARSNESARMLPPRSLPQKLVDDTQPSSTPKAMFPHSDDNVTSKSVEGAGESPPTSPPHASTVDAKASAMLKDDFSHHHGSTSHPGSALGPSPTPRTWQDILNEGMSRHRRCRAEKEAQEKARQTRPFTRHKKMDGLSEEETIVPIAAFWEALRCDGQLFAFADLEFFGQVNSGQANSHLKDRSVVGAPRKFIMPFLVHPQLKKGVPATERTDQLGHLVLFLAEWFPEKEKVRLDLWDSLVGHVFKKDLIERAKDLIVGSHWPYDQEQRPPPTFFSAVTSLSCPQQEVQNTCGFNMILNAWSVMLGIPISKTETRRVRKGSSRLFVRDGCEIINLAMMGCMDAHTVQAFLNVWGYCQAQSPEEILPRNVTAVRMDLALLRSALYQQAVSDGTTPSRDEVQNLILTAGLEDRVTFEQMKAKLIEEEGNGNRAIERLLSPCPETSSVTPPESEALQTKSKGKEKAALDSSVSPEEEQLSLAIEMSMQPPSPAAVGNVTDSGKTESPAAAKTVAGPEGKGSSPQPTSPGQNS